MKFDTVRAWKDENYRQSLNNEQSSTLPANPAGELELSNTEMESINGGDGYGPGGYGILGASSSSHADEQSFHSLAFRCNENVFSLTATSGFSVLSPVNAFCINDDENNGHHNG